MRANDLETGLDRSIRRHAAIIFLAVAVLVLGLGGWSYATSIAGAIIAPGRVAVETSTKTVQHAEGGIIAEIAVTDGSSVAAGDLLMRLDDTVVRSSLDIVRSRMDQLSGLTARLEAELTGQDIVWPERLRERAQDHAYGSAIATIMAGEQALLASRRAAHEGRQAQLAEQIAQIEAQTVGLGAQLDAKADELAIIDTELSGVVQLHEQGLTPVTRVNALQREQARLRGEHGRMISEVARAQQTVSERRAQLLQLDADFRADALETLQGARAEFAELAEREAAALDRLARIELRAPQAGVVHNLATQTVGGVIAPGDVVLEVVPQSGQYIVEAAVLPTDVDQVQPGQVASVRLTGLDARTTPEIRATVESVSADLVSRADGTGAHYRLRLRMDESALDEAGIAALVPGMPAEAFLKTSERTVLSYVLQPITDQLSYAFREQ